MVFSGSWRNLSSLMMFVQSNAALRGADPLAIIDFKNSEAMIALADQSGMDSIKAEDPAINNVALNMRPIG
jgi:hypothetical protein